MLRHLMISLGMWMIWLADLSGIWLLLKGIGSATTTMALIIGTLNIGIALLLIGLLMDRFGSIPRMESQNTPVKRTAKRCPVRNEDSTLLNEFLDVRTS